MTLLMRAPRARFAKKGANPGLEKIELVEQVLRASGPPLSRNAIRAELHAWGKDMNDASLNAVLLYLASDGKIIEGSQGIDWVRPAEGTALETILRQRA